jgi:NhaA family Na+:H+ antiporter
MEPVGPADHRLGPAHTAVTIVEYGDYESPACGRAYVELERLRDRFPADLALVYRHLPLVDEHPQATAAALTAEAAAEAGQFWTMHELLYNRQDRLADSDLAGYGTQLGVAAAGAIGAHVARVEGDMAGARAAGITGVPALFVNGERYDGAIELGALSDAVEAAGAQRSG